AATVNISGSVDLTRETQRLRVRVQPALATSISAGAAALFIANPLVGAAVGAGTLLAQKILKDPLEQLFSYEYGVTGGWADPVVQPIEGRASSALPTQAATL
ncbi:MAG: AsmA-like C-terminal region-containing protein, partial [Casimicrobiaceae bacterium]